MTPTYNNLGSVYQDKGEWDKAIEYFQRCIKILERIGDKDKAEEYKQKSDKIKIE